MWEPAPVDGPGAGLRIFTRQYYSHQLINTKRRRADLSDNPTAAELIATWGVFGSNGGRYEVRHDTIVTYPSVAKNPRAMAEGFRGRFPFHVIGDTL